jgi:hypothetical protein
MARADQKALMRSKKMSSEALEIGMADLQHKTADLLAEKAGMQIQIQALEHAKCQLCAQVRLFRSVFML